MPPLKVYTFENLLNSNIAVTIKAYSFEGAYELLVSTTKHPADYKHIPNWSIRLK